MMPDDVEYQSYVLRVWRTRQADRRVWRATVQAIPDGPPRGFASLVDLLDALESPPCDRDPADRGPALVNSLEMGDAPIIEDS